MVPILIGILCISLPIVYEETLTENLGGRIDVEITYPEKIIVVREDTTSILIKNNGWVKRISY